MNGKARLADRARKTLKSLPRLVATLGCVGLLIGGLGVIAMQGLALVLDDGTQKRVVHVFIADLNGDGHQDVYIVTNQMHSIAFNDGTGKFTSSRELFMRKYALALGDLNGNGQLDAILTKFESGEMGGDLILECGEMSSEYIFPVSTVDIPNQVFAVRDGNGDGIPEDFVAGCCGGGTTMMNYELLPSDRHPCLGSAPPAAAALGDLNGDGSLDVFLAKGWMLVNGKPQSTTPNEVWFNDGTGNFTDSGQRLGNSQSFYVALGDLNNDGFLDAVVGNRNGGEVWFNDGQGNFTKGSQRLGRGATGTIFVTDLDGDGNLDLFLGGDTSGRVWLNDGRGQFKAGQRIAYSRSEAVALGDVTGDGVADIFVGGPDYYQVWRGNGDGTFIAGSRSEYR
jgi:hypothetical protein